jgi:DNA-directed RNA polymerase sigma subunit (sigma70/sigma32)
MNMQEAWDRGRQPRKKPAMAGENNPRAKLTRRSAENIRRRYAKGGVTLQSLANEYGVSQSTVGYVVKGVTW